MIDIALKALLRRVFRVTLSLLSFSMLSGCSSEGGVVDAPTTQQQTIPDSAVIWQVENIQLIPLQVQHPVFKQL